MEPLLPDRHPNYDLFICDVLDAIPKDDVASMEHPVFSLSTKPDMRHLRYEHNGNMLEIIPSGIGLATIHDKDVLIYCASQIIAKMRERETPARTVQLKAYDLLLFSNRQTSGEGYRKLKAGLDRLRGTTIKTSVRTDGIKIMEGFGLIDRYKIVERRQVNERMIAIEITLSEWFFNAIKAYEVLTLHRDYFRLRKPMERRIYELARKHCGANEKWTVRLETLKKKIGTTAPLKKFRFNVRKLVETNHLPDYKIKLSGDAVTFTSRRTPAFEGKVHLPRLRPETFEKAKWAAPGWDVYHLEREWRGWIADKEKPKNPDAAFIAFCRKKYQREGSPERNGAKRTQEP
jgi:plasmid replication initiation protein